MRVHYLQHVPFEGPGCIETWAAMAGHTISGTRLYQNDRLPAIDSIDLMVVMGGPMSVHDTVPYPWLVDEKRFLDRAVAHGLPVLGICLGAQLIADILGARVYAHVHKEIGWFPIHKRPEAAQTRLGDILPDVADVVHWHGDTFDLPAGSVHLAESRGCRHQGFAIDNRIVGLQFHLELDPAGLALLVAHGRDEMVPGRFVQTPAQVLARQNGLDRLNKIMYRLLDAFGDL